MLGQVWSGCPVAPLKRPKWPKMTKNRSILAQKLAMQAKLAKIDLKQTDFDPI